LDPHNDGNRLTPLMENEIFLRLLRQLEQHSELTTKDSLRRFCFNEQFETHEEYETQYLYRCTLCNACTG